MQLDKRLSLDDTPAAAAHRERAPQSQAKAPETTPGTPTDRTQAGGPTPVSPPRQGTAQDATSAGRAAPEATNRRRAEDEASRLLHLPADTRVEIHVDVQKQEVRFQIRERATGRLLREVPPDETRPLLDRLRDLSGVLVDRAC